MNKAGPIDERGRAYTFSPGKLQEKDKLKRTPEAALEKQK